MTYIPALPDIVLEPIVRLALSEDLGRAGDAQVAVGAWGRLPLREESTHVILGADLEHLLQHKANLRA